MSDTLETAVACLSKSLLGKELSLEQLGELSPYLRVLTVPAGELLIRDGDLDHRLFVIRRGAFEASRPRGLNPLSFTQVGPGDIIGEIGFLEGLARTATVRATEAAEVYTLSRSEFERLIEENPRIACGLLRALLRSVHGVVSRLTDKNVDLLGYIYS